ncbi:MAG: insulinase family protein [Desulfovibrionaceae bacterium]|nr:insulinase family protein [Desulfovibrionaceae bacterium]
MNTHGFELIREEHLPEISGTARLWRHPASGAELLSIVNHDENKCFGVTFRTPPENSTGVAHIMEHSVLCGSEKYPVKEPFVVLLKGSLNTFLNAFTFPDKTCYPVASTNLQDFRNLVDVYLDAVFFPKITQSTFEQEGWHIETEDAQSPLRYKGVVFNEMKGVYSSADALLAEKSQQSLFPDMTYGLDSGGDPAEIPFLTYKAFREFHERYYHPSNARFFFWGDDPEEERFAMLDPYISRFTARSAATSRIPLQPCPDLPRQLEYPYASGDEEGDKEHITVNWLICETSDIRTVMTLEALSHILLGMPGSPLRKALIESGLGEDISGSGPETDLRQTYFSVGMRSVTPGSCSEVEQLIFETLADLAEKGIPQKAVEAAVNSLEFSLRENNSGRFPRGLDAMLRSLTSWLYDGDPFAPLAWEKPLAELKQRIQSGEPVFKDAIRRFFIDNRHRTVVMLKPDSGLAERREQEEQAKLERIASALTKEDREELARHTAELIAAQKAPDDPENLAKIPSLHVSDLPQRASEIPSEIGHDEDTEILIHDLETSGILYSELLFPMEQVPDRLMPLVPLFCRCLTEIGTTRQNYVDLGADIASKTGGIAADILRNTVIATREPVLKLCISGKATADHIEDLFRIEREIILETDFDNRERFTQMLTEERARMEQSVIPNGHRIVLSRLRASACLTGHIEELTDGISYLSSLRELCSRIETKWESILQDLLILKDILLKADNITVNLTGTPDLTSRAVREALALRSNLPRGRDHGMVQRIMPSAIIDEAFITPAQINYVGKGANLFTLGYSWHGSAPVIAHYLRTSWLWDQVRVVGGAYGALCSIDGATGAMAFASYRDPNVRRTLNVYDATAIHLQTMKLSRHDLELAIIGAVGDIDAYLLPDARGFRALIRHLTGNTAERRQTLREELLGTTAKHFEDFKGVMEEFAARGTICVLGGSETEREADLRGWHKQRIL